MAISDARAKRVSAHLRRAAKLIEKHGWCQNTRRTLEGHMCIRGALLMAIYRDPYNGNPMNAQYQACVERLSRAGVCGAQWCGEVNWNDTKGRTSEQVINALKRAASYTARSAASTTP